MPTITLYHPTASGPTRRELTVPYALWAAAADPSGGYQRQDGESSFFLIPWQEDLEITPGDGIFPGIGPEAQNLPLKNLSPEMEIIHTVRLYQVLGALDHWEVSSR